MSLPGQLQVKYPMLAHAVLNFTISAFLKIADIIQQVSPSAHITWLYKALSRPHKTV